MATRRELEQTGFLYGGNSSFIEELYARYLADPSAVEPSWRAYFDALEPENRILFERARAALAPRPRDLRPLPANLNLPVGSIDDPATKALIHDHLRVIMLIRAYRVRGHLLANLDPLGLARRNDHYPELDYKAYGFTDADLDREFYLDYVLGLEKASLRRIMEILRKTYSGTVGIEFMHIQDAEQKTWIQSRIEGTGGLFDSTAEDKREILEQLTEAEGFEQFLHVKFPGTKRFGLDGGESTIPALETMLRTAAGLGVDEIVIGMPHRGRLNVLANVMGKPYAAILSEFQGGSYSASEVLGSGDVKYHLGTSTDQVLPDGRTMHLSLTANPSHLEAVNPVVMGKVRAKQRQKGDAERSRVMPVLMHGDAAFIGLGVVAECLEMMDLKGYRVGGTIHLIINNQIGFTTSPAYSRSSPYPSDVARGVQAPYDAVTKQLEAAHEASRGYKANKADWLEGAWRGIQAAPEEYERGSTAVPVDTLRDLGLKMTELPASLNVHPRLKRVIGARRRSIEEGSGIDWATAEHLAFGSLLIEGFPVRLSGEDVGRGTFSQRHAIIYDQATEQRYVPLEHLREKQAPFEVFDSLLSEEGVLGYEYGYSLADPSCLTCWEAQFGDFANGAQVYFDQFISSGESKWLRLSGLVCLLPHGYEGQGPEHSSAKLERWLQLYAQNNMAVVYPSTPPSSFPALRRPV